MSASDTVLIRINGRGGHAARPHLAVDPILIAGSLVMALQSVVSRNIDPTQTAIVTIGTLNAGIASQRDSRERLAGAQRALLQPRGARASCSSESPTSSLTTCRAMAAASRSTTSAAIRWWSTAAAETEFARSVAEELVGAERTIAPFGPVTGSEDFAYYLQHRPGCFLRLGNGEDAPMLHNAAYDFNDGNLTVGAAYWTRLVERYLAQDESPA